MQALRLDIAGELEAIFLYNTPIARPRTPQWSKPCWLTSVTKRRSTGETITLMSCLGPKAAERILEGGNEVHEMLETLNLSGTLAAVEDAPGESGAGTESAPAPTVSDMTGKQPRSGTGLARAHRSIETTAHDSLSWRNQHGDSLARRSAPLSAGL